MRFWDTSAIVPLIVGQSRSAAVRAAFELDPAQVVWWSTEVECCSAVSRLEREGVLAPADVVAAFARLGALAAAWQQVEPIAPVRQAASRLVRVHPLRAADALQLAAAITAAAGEPAALHFVTLDERLGLAAAREGFPVIIPG